MEMLDMHMTTQLMKAAASYHATNAVKRSRDGGAGSQQSRQTEGFRDGSRRNRVELWRLHRAYDMLAVQLDILEQPSIPFSGTEVMNPIPQTPEDLVFGREDLRAGCREGIY
jgi:hypothetical protein